MAPSQLQARNPTLFQNRNETEDLFFDIQVKRIIEKECWAKTWFYPSAVDWMDADLNANKQL